MLQFLYNMHERNELVERVYAFTDESGAFGWDIENPNVSTHFIITAIIVKEPDLEGFTQKAEALRKKHFQTGEIKSSNIGGNHARRLRVLADLQGIPFSIFSVCVDKKKCIENMSMKGLQYKKTFYKFMNNIVHIGSHLFTEKTSKTTSAASVIMNSEIVDIHMSLVISCNRSASITFPISEILLF